MDKKYIYAIYKELYNSYFKSCEKNLCIFVKLNIMNMKLFLLEL